MVFSDPAWVESLMYDLTPVSIAFRLNGLFGQIQRPLTRPLPSLGRLNSLSAQWSFRTVIYFQRKSYRFQAPYLVILKQVAITYLFLTPFKAVNIVPDFIALFADKFAYSKGETPLER